MASDKETSGPGRRHVQRAPEEQLAFLAEASHGFAASLNIDVTLRNAITRFMTYLDAEAASIFLLENNGRELVCRACAGKIDITGLRLDAGQGIVGKVVRLNSSDIVRDVREDPDFSNAVDEETGFETRSILCAPLSIKGECLGALELINKRSGDGLFDDQDRHLATALSSSAALAIHNARMAQSLIEQERMQTELSLAREIQHSLLPDSANDDLPVAGINLPAREVSGDFYDYLELADGRIYFSLADVSGKGMNAALMMAKTSSLLRCLVKTTPEPGSLLERVNNEVYETATRGMFVTVVAGLYDPASGGIVMANAGHQPPLLRDAAGVFTEYEAESPPLGIAPDLTFKETTFSLDDGGLYLFTDGVTEAKNSDGKMFGVGGLIDLINKLSGVSPVQRLQRIVSEISVPDGKQHDDVTVLLVEQWK